MSVNTTIQLRRGSGENWNSVNPTLNNGELGLNTDNNLFKVGDGLTSWTSLPYYPGIPLSSGSGIGFVELKDSNSVVTGITVFNAIKAGANIDLSLSGNDIVIAGSSPTTVSQGTGVVVVQSGDDYEINLDNEHVRDLIGGIVAGNSGVGVYVNDVADTITFSVTGIFSTQINDFNSAVDARVTAGSISEETIIDIVASGLAGGTGIYLEYDDNITNLINVNVTGVSFSGHTHDDRYYTETELNTDGAGGQVHWGNLTNKPTGFTPVAHTHTSTDITDFTEAAQDVVGGMVMPGTGISVAYDDTGNTLTINVSGYAFTDHTHKWYEIDASTKATPTELGYLSGVTPGTALENRALVVDSNKDLSSLRDFTATGLATLGSISTTSNVNIGGALVVAGNLTVSGTTTTVNSTTVDIGDNIIQVNVSGAETQGGIQVLDHDSSTTLKLAWDNTDNRWEFEGGTADIYTTGNITANSFNGNGSNVTNLDFNNITSNIPDPTITGILTGAVTGSSSVTLTSLTNGNLTISTVLADNAVTSSKILDGTIVNADINDSAAIAVTKLANSGVTLGTTVVNLGQSTSVIDGLTRISGVSSASPVYLHYAIIDGGTP